jgi:hypothetical protein
MAKVTNPSKKNQMMPKDPWRPMPLKYHLSESELDADVDAEGEPDFDAEGELDIEVQDDGRPAKFDYAQYPSNHSGDKILIVRAHTVRIFFFIGSFATFRSIKTIASLQKVMMLSTK